MTRPIKFRAWNTEMNHMVFPSLEFGRELFPCSYKRIIKSETGKDGYIQEVVLEMVSVDHILQSPEFEVMQFTGLTDRNGVEVYEGDLLSIDPFLQVVYLDGGFCFYNPAFTGADRLSQDRVGRLSVIGNIYQNPELLEGGNPA